MAAPYDASSAPNDENVHARHAVAQVLNSPTTTDSETSETEAVTELKRILEVGEDEGADGLIDFAIREKPNLSAIVLAGLCALRSKESQETATTELPNSSMKSHQTHNDDVFPPLAFRVSLDIPSLLNRNPEITDMWLERTCNGRLTIPLSFSLHSDPSFLPDPLADGIFLRAEAMMEVCYQNCRALGLTFQEACRHTCPSPWHHPILTPSAIIALKNIPPDLYPTPAQLRYPHHPFIDFFPFPWFRERAVMLASLEPPAYDRWELKADIFSGGMVCWRSRAGWEGQSWDRRSWEVQPWFLKKWGWLVEEQGRVGQQSRWWRALRGE